MENIHTDSITSLHLNPNIIQCLASGAADNTVAIWDIDQRKSVHQYTFDHVVTQVQFNPNNSQKNVLCALTEEHCLNFIDCREEKVVATIDLGQFMGNSKCQALCVCQSEFDENVC